MNVKHPFERGVSGGSVGVMSVGSVGCVEEQRHGVVPMAIPELSAVFFWSTHTLSPTRNNAILLPVTASLVIKLPQQSINRNAVVAIVAFTHGGVMSDGVVGVDGDSVGCVDAHSRKQT